MAKIELLAVRAFLEIVNDSKVVFVDDSFSHEFGIEPRHHFEVVAPDYPVCPVLLMKIEEIYGEEIWNFGECEAQLVIDNFLTYSWETL